MPAVPGQQRLLGVQQGHAPQEVPGGHFCDQQSGGDAVLVPGVIAHHIADGLLVAQHTGAALRCAPVGPLGDELKAGEAVGTLGPQRGGHGPGQLGGDDGFDHQGLLGQGAGLPLSGQDIVGQQGTHPVGRDGAVFPVGPPYHDAQPVGVRIGAQDQMTAPGFCHLDGQGKAGRVLRIGGAQGGEVSVPLHLLRHTMQHRQSGPGRDLRHDGSAHPVEGAVGHGKALCSGSRDQAFVHPALEHGGNIGFIHLGPQQGDAAVGQGSVIVAEGCPLQHIDLCHMGGDPVGQLGADLGAGLPVDLVAVVFLGVVAGGHIDAGAGAQVPDGKGKLRRGPHVCKEPDLEPVGGQHPGGLPGEPAAVDAAVPADTDPTGGKGFPLLQDHPGKGLGGLPDGVDIDVADAHAHDAPQPGGAETQGGKEAAFQLGPVRPQGGQLGPLRLRQHRGIQPAPVFLHIIHQDRSSRENRIFHYISICKKMQSQVVKSQIVCF